jgi:hypothetical protein
MRAHEKAGYELLLGEPEIVAWLEPNEHEHEEEEKSTPAPRRRLEAHSTPGNRITPGGT